MGSLGRVRRRWWFLGATALVLLVAAGPMVWVQATGHRGAVSLDDVEPVPVVVVFGAGVRPDGVPSAYLRYRLEAARQLHEAGTVSVVLVSGDNGQAGYDEPTVMADWLVDRGVPRDRVVLDYAGFSSHDTCVRAVEVFGVTEAVLVTQDYPLPRATYLCRTAGMDVQGVGVVADGGSRDSYRLRELPASWKAWWDVTTNRSPTFPGPKETSVDDALRATDG
jgi:vancomycin permeability regulator SanA